MGQKIFPIKFDLAWQIQFPSCIRWGRRFWKMRIILQTRPWLFMKVNELRIDLLLFLSRHWDIIELTIFFTHRHFPGFEALLNAFEKLDFSVNHYWNRERRGLEELAGKPQCGQFGSLRAVTLLHLKICFVLVFNVKTVYASFSLPWAKFFSYLEGIFLLFWSLVSSQILSRYFSSLQSFYSLSHSWWWVQFSLMLAVWSGGFSLRSGLEFYFIFCYMSYYILIFLRGGFSLTVALFFCTQNCTPLQDR